MSLFNRPVTFIVRIPQQQFIANSAIAEQRGAAFILTRIEQSFASLTTAHHAMFSIFDAATVLNDAWQQLKSIGVLQFRDAFELKQEIRFHRSIRKWIVHVR